MTQYRRLATVQDANKQFNYTIRFGSANLQTAGRYCGSELSFYIPELPTSGINTRHVMIKDCKLTCVGYSCQQEGGVMDVYKNGVVAGQFTVTFNGAMPNTGIACVEVNFKRGDVVELVLNSGTGPLSCGFNLSFDNADI